MSFEAHTDRVGTAVVLAFLGELDIASEAPRQPRSTPRSTTGASSSPISAG